MAVGNEERPGASQIGAEASNNDFASRWAILLITVALTLLAFPPRLIHLDALSFYADEETMSLPARSLAAGDGAQFPSGMQYRRGLPLTWLNSVSARVFGIDEDVSYRIPTAVLSALTIPLVFLLGRLFIGSPAALLAALLMALSEWHLVFSRQSRMYAPFILFLVAASLAIWRWERRDRVADLLLAAVLTVTAIAFHSLSVLIAIVAIIPLAFAGWGSASIASVIAFAAATGIGARLYGVKFVMAAYPGSMADTQAAVGRSLPNALATLPSWWWLLAITGVAVGFWAATRAGPADEEPGHVIRTLGRYSAAGLVGAAVFLGQLYAAAIALLLYLVPHPGDRRELVRASGPPLLVSLLACLAWIAARAWGWGPVEGAKLLIEFPYPYPAFLFIEMPGVLMLFGAACLWGVLTPYRQKEMGLRASVLVSILIIAFVGALRPWGGGRFLLPAYPFLLMSAAVVMVGLLSEVGRRTGRWGLRIATVAALALAASGVLGGHGIPQTVRTVGLDHGEPVSSFIHMYPFRPDHQAPGRFVSGERKPGDLIIAEDPLQQYWYAGPIDYWLRSYQDTRPFVLRDADGQLRDSYVNSVALGAASRLDSIVESAPGRVWLITSGETYLSRSYYLSPDQLEWLEAVEDGIEPAFVGRDGVTKVYCLNCPE